MRTERLLPQALRRKLLVGTAGNFHMAETAKPERLAVSAVLSRFSCVPLGNSARKLRRADSFPEQHRQSAAHAAGFDFRGALAGLFDSLLEAQKRVTLFCTL